MINRETKWAAVLATVVLALAFWAGLQDPDRVEKNNASRLPDNATPHRYDISLHVDPAQTTFSGRVEIALSLDHATSSITLHGRDLNIDDIYIELANRQRITGHWQTLSVTGLSRIHFDGVVPDGRHRLHIAYRAPFNGQLQGLYRVHRDGRDYAYTQLEAIDARRVFPGFDEPRYKTPFALTLTIPQGLQAVANMTELERKSDSNQHIIRFHDTPALPTYLLAFAIGDFDIVDAKAIAANTIREYDIPLRAVAIKGEGERMRYALEHTEALMTALENYFGIPYPFPKLDLIAVPDFASAAMENPGALTFDSTVISIDADSPFYLKREFILTHAHELAHQWFGNLVNMPWWNDVWLNEAFASWMGTKIAHQVYPELEFALDTQTRALQAMLHDNRIEQRPVRQAIDNDADADLAFDDITYDKGAGILTMFERYMGASAFQHGVRTYFARHAFGIATAPDFINAISEATGTIGVPESFMGFLQQSGMPVVQIARQCHNNQLQLAVNQQRYLPLGSTDEKSAKHWDIPFCISLTGAAQSRQCTLLSAAQTLWQVPVECSATLMPNADGAGFYRWHLDAQSLQQLLANFERLSAAEALDVAANLSADWRSGRLSLEEYMQAIKTISAYPLATVAQYPLNDARELLSHLLPEPIRPAAARFFTERWPLSAPQASQLTSVLRQPAPASNGRTTEQWLAYLQRVEFYALALRNPVWRTFLQEQIQPWLVPPHPNPILIPELFDTALSVAGETSNAEQVRSAVNMARELDDAGWQLQLLQALQTTTDVNGQNLIADVFWDERFALDVRRGLLIEGLKDIKNWPRHFHWLQTHFEQLLPLLPEVWRSRLPDAMSALCDETQLAQAEQFFVRNAKLLPGSQLSTRSAAEHARQCIALKASLTATPASVFNGVGK